MCPLTSPYMLQSQQKYVWKGRISTPPICEISQSVACRWILPQSCLPHGLYGTCTQQSHIKPLISCVWERRNRGNYLALVMVTICQANFRRPRILVSIFDSFQGTTSVIKECQPCRRATVSSNDMRKCTAKINAKYLTWGTPLSPALPRHLHGSHYNAVSINV